MRELVVTVWCDPHFKRDVVKFEAVETISMPVGSGKFLEMDLCNSCLHQKLSWQGWTQLFRDYGHKPEPEPVPRKKPATQYAKAEPTNGQTEFPCACGEVYESQRKLNGHIGQRGRHPDGREHKDLNWVKSNQERQAAATSEKEA